MKVQNIEMQKDEHMKAEVLKKNMDTWRSMKKKFSHAQNMKGGTKS